MIHARLELTVRFATTALGSSEKKEQLLESQENCTTIVKVVPLRSDCSAHCVMSDDDDDDGLTDKNLSIQKKVFNKFSETTYLNMQMRHDLIVTTDLIKVGAYFCVYRSMRFLSC